MTPYGKMPDGREVSLYTLTNGNGVVMRVTDYGAIITELWVPDKNGAAADVAFREARAVARGGLALPLADIGVAAIEAREITTIAVSPTPANMSCFWVTVRPTSAPAAYVTTLLAEKTITIPSTSSSMVVLNRSA